MLIARAPLRISLAGGGTDLEAYYGKYGGAVISATIDKFFYVIMTTSDADSIQVSSSDYKTFYRHNVEENPLWDGDLRLPKVIINHFGIRSGISVFLASQVPPGTGLGSSSTVAVALIKALSVLCRVPMTAAEVAELASEIEIDRLGMPIGKQDQFAASFGGLNYIDFQTSGVTVTPLLLPFDVSASLQRRLMLFFTGRSHNSADILSQQKKSSEQNRGQVIDSLHLIKREAEEFRSQLLRGNIDFLGQCLDRSWHAKRRLAPGVTDPWIDQWYETAREAGAAGGKITGAGGGGFLLLYCEPENQERVTAALEWLGLHRMDFQFEGSGAMVLVNTEYANVARVLEHA